MSVPSRMIDTSSTSISPAVSITSRSRFHIMKSLRKKTKHDRHSICRFNPANLRDARYMKAKIISGRAPGGERTRLADVLPLKTPFVVQIFPIYACNFTCEYCFHAVPRRKRGFVSDWPVMKYDLYKKCIDELALFDDRLKVLRFVGMGEPLLHKNIADMIAYAVAGNVALRVELLTNGSLLTRQM